jgi:hypothetical protein
MSAPPSSLTEAARHEERKVRLPCSDPSRIRGIKVSVLIFALHLAFGPLETAEEAAALWQELPTDTTLATLTPEAIALAFRARSSLEFVKTL